MAFFCNLDARAPRWPRKAKAANPKFSKGSSCPCSIAIRKSWDRTNPLLYYGRALLSRTGAYGKRWIDSAALPSPGIRTLMVLILGFRAPD